MFLDTSGLHSLLDRHDAAHNRAVEQFRIAPRIVTHNYVVAEFIALAAARRLPRERVLEYVTDLADHPLLDFVWIDEMRHASALSLLRNRLDQTYSLCDAVSFIVMRERAETEALTTDRHFEQEGFTGLLMK